MSDKNSTENTENQVNPDDSLPEVVIPASVFELDSTTPPPLNTVQSAQEYISILLKEIEECKKEIAELRIPKQERKNPWKFCSFFLMLVIIGCFFWFHYLEDYFHDEPKEVIQVNNNPQLTQGAEPEPVTTKYTIVDLDSYVKQISQKTFHPFTASVERKYGYECMCLSYQNIRIYYQNEFEIEDVQNQHRVMIDNGTVMTEFDWNYDLTKPVEALVPRYGTFSGDARMQLLFIRFDEDVPSFPVEMRFIDASSLFHYDEINVENAIAGLFATEFSEEPGVAGDTDSRALMKLSFAGVPYTYRVNREDYIDAELYQEALLRFKEKFTIQYADGGITFSAVVSINNNRYLGEVTGVIKRDELAFVLTDLRYGAYVDATQEDYGSDGVITPYTYIMTDRVVINGKNKERWLIPVSDEIVPCSLNWDNWIGNETGTYAYFEGDRATTIHGIDVSKYQGDIDWERVKAAGVEYAIIRLGFRGMGEGTLELDPYFVKNIKGANDAGVAVGVYFFSQAITEDEAVEEAQMVLSYIKDYDVTYPVVIDTEAITTYDARANNLLRSERTDICIAFCEEIKKAGYQPMIYANTRYMIMGLELEKLKDYDKWFAYYGTNYTFPYEFQIYQYSDTGTIDGIEGNVDLNASFIDYAGRVKTEDSLQVEGTP